MKKLNILFCDNNSTTLSNAMSFFADDSDLALLSCNTRCLFADFLNLGIDAIVIDSDFNGAKELLRTLGDRRPKVVLTTSQVRDDLEDVLPSSLYDYCFFKPYSFIDLRAKLLSLLITSNQMHVKTSTSHSIDERLSSIFIRAGIPPHIKGYQFLREAVKLSVNEPDMINAITKRLYPSVAQVYNTTASKVERAIRHAIEVAWNRGKIENINAVFGIKIYNKGEKPTNGELIALVADKIMIENL